MQKRELLFLFLLILIKSAYQYSIYSDGFISVSADEYTRGIRAFDLSRDWAGELKFYTKAWLPFELYLNAAAYTLWPDPLLAPRSTVFICSLLLLIFFYKLIRGVFGNPQVAAIASALVVTHPWYIWLSGTPMLDMYYISFFIIGLYFVFEWRRGGSDRKLWIGLLFFIISSGFHTQSWIIINLTNVMLVAEAFVFGKSSKGHQRIVRVMIFGALSNAFAIIYLINEYRLTGTPLSFFAMHTDYSKWFYDGYRIALSKKVLYYPVLTARWLHFTGLLVAISFLPLTKLEAWVSKSFLLFLGILSLAAFSFFNILSVPATAAPARYMFPFLIFFSPYAALTIWSFSKYIGARLSKTAEIFALIGLILPICLLNLSISQKPTGGLDPDAIKAGLRVSELYDEGEVSSAEKKLLIELSYWDYLAVQLMSEQGKLVVFDRPKDSRRRNLPSDIENLSDGQIRDYLVEKNIALIVLRSDALKKRLSPLGFVMLLDEVGGWQIFKFIQKVHNA